MAEDFNINIRNGMGGGKTASQKKLSAKGSIQRAKETTGGISRLKRGLGIANKAISTGMGASSSGVLSSGLGKLGVAGAITGFVLANAEKIALFGVNIYEAQTGNQMASHNARTTIKTISSLGTNYLSGYIENELFTKKTISRQNYGMDYGRELYSINVEGTKNKRI